MKCLILAAGYATRLYPLTENYPKPLLKIKGKPIIEWLVDDIESNMDIDQFIIVSNHKFVRCFEEWKTSVVTRNKLVILDDGSTNNDNRLGAVKDIQYAIEHIHISDDLLVIAGDNLLDFSLKGFAEFFEMKRATCIMRHEETDVAKLQRTGVASIDENEKVIEMEEKPCVPKSIWAVPPFYFYHKNDLKFFDRKHEGNYGIDAPGSFISWLCTKTDVYAFNMPGKRFDIGNLQTYESANENYCGIIK